MLLKHTATIRSYYGQALREIISFWQSSTFHFPSQASFSSPLMKATGRTKHTLPHNYTVIKHSLNTFSGGTNDPLFQPHLIAGVHTTSYHYPSMVRISRLLYKKTFSLSLSSGQYPLDHPHLCDFFIFCHIHQLPRQV